MKAREIKRFALNACSRAEAEQRIDAAMALAGQPQAASALKSALLPAARIVAGGTTRGRSRLFGDEAMLSDGTPWSTWHEFPLAVVAVIDCSELPDDIDIGLPRTGFLSVFYDIAEEPWGFDPGDRDGHRCHFNPSADARFAPRPALPDTRLRKQFHRGGAATWHPQPVDADMEGWPALPIRFETMWTLPAPGSIDHELMMARSGIDGLSESEQERLSELMDTLAGNRVPAHRLGGHAGNVQGDMQSEAQFASHGVYCGDAFDETAQRQAERLAAGIGDWRLLLQIDSDDNGPMFGDCGRVYIWIRTQDLAVRDFSNTWAILQCS